MSEFIVKEYHKLDCIETGVHGLRHVCFVSPEIVRSTKCSGKNDFIFIRENADCVPASKLLKTESCETMRENSLSYCSCSESALQRRSNCDESVLASFLSKQNLVSFNRIALNCHVDKEVFDDGEKCLEILDSIQNWIKIESEIPCTEGQTLNLATSISSDLQLFVSYTEPSSSGIWNTKTAVEVEFVEDNYKYGNETKKLSTDIRTIQSVICFSGSLISSYTKHSEKYAENIKRWASNFFQFQMKEIPSKLVSILIKESGIKNDQRSLITSGVVIVSPNSKLSTRKNIQIKTFSGVVSLLPVIVSNIDDDEFDVFCTPCLLKSMQNVSQRQNEGIFSDKVKVEIPKTEPEIVKVSKLEVSSFNCQLLNELSPRDVDSLLEEFFRRPKLFPIFANSSGNLKRNGTIFQINIFEHLTFKTEHLRWDIKSQNSADSLMFRIDNFETVKPLDKFVAGGRVNALISVCSKYSSLLLSSKLIYEPLPSETKTFTRNWNLNKKFEIFENLPPSVARQRDKLSKMLTSFFNADNVSGKPVLLVFGPRGCGKLEMFSSLSLKVGLPLVSYDCGAILGDSSGATEVKLKRIFAQTKDESPVILLLRNVHILARNRDGEKDQRVLSALSEEIENIRQTSKVRNFIFLICETDLSPHSGGLDESLASLFEHQAVFDADNQDQDEKLERRQTLEWVIKCEHGRSCVDHGEFIKNVAIKYEVTLVNFLSLVIFFVF